MIDPSIRVAVEDIHRLQGIVSKEEFISNTNELLKHIKRDRPRDLTRFLGWNIIEILNLGFYLSVIENNYQHLNDAFFTYCRLYYFDFEYRYKHKQQESTSNQEDYIFSMIIMARASNDNMLIKLLIENYDRPIKKIRNKYVTAYANIILGIELEDQNRINQGISYAQDLLKQKLPIYSRYEAEMLLSIAKKDIGKFNESTQKAIDTYTFYTSRQLGYGSGLYRYLPLDILGLIKIGEKYIGEKLYKEFVEPESKIWYPEWFSMIKKGQTGKNFINFTGDSSYLNKMIQTLEVQ